MSGTGIKGKQIADGTVEGVDIDWNPHLEMQGHIIPDGNATYDLGNASYKIRHLFLSDNSLWIGDSHKVDVEGGKKKHRKRKKTTASESLLAIRQPINTGGFSSLSGDDTGVEDEALIHASKVADQGAANALVTGPGGTREAALASMTLNDWISYARTLPGQENVDVTDIFKPGADDWEEVIEDGEGILPTAPAHSLFLKSSTESSIEVYEIKVADGGIITATLVGS